ncbi:MAG TPA: hypothetical protein VFV00_13885 [Acidimicrobiales bacterium]|nr:hypothetical protein [Acidimicrobiales bacterium]
MAVGMSFIVGAAPPASASTPATLQATVVPGPDSELCQHHQIDYRGHDESNNVTIAVNDAWKDYSDEAYCPIPEQAMAITDSGATIAAVGPSCTAALAVGECDVELLDKVVVNTAAGDDTIRIGNLPSFAVSEIWAGAGNDAIRTLNNVKDIVHCGDGHDVVIADSTDEISSDCEVVQFTDSAP